MIPDIAASAVFQETASLFRGGIGCPGDDVASTRDDAILSRRSYQTRYLFPARRTFSPKKRPFLTPAIVFEYTDPVFTALASFLNDQPTTLLQAVYRRGIGHGRLDVMISLNFRPWGLAPAKERRHNQQGRSRP